MLRSALFSSSASNCSAFAFYLHHFLHRCRQKKRGDSISFTESIKSLKTKRTSLNCMDSNLLPYCFRNLTSLWIWEWAFKETKIKNSADVFVLLIILCIIRKENNPQNESNVSRTSCQLAISSLFFFNQNTSKSSISQL